MRLKFLLLLLMVCTASLAAQPEILYYKFDETSGASARNDALPGQGWTNGALSAAPLWNTTDPQIPTAAVNNTGQGRRMSTGYSMSERNGQAFTIEFWFRTTGGGYQDFCNDSNTFGIWLLNGTIQVNINGIRLNSSGGQNDGQWRYCALTRDTGNGFTLYWGTTAGGLSTDTATYNMTFSSSAFEMLYWQAAVPATYSGEMDEFRLWSVERTQAELQANRFTSFTTQDLDVFDPSMQFIKHQGDSNYTNVTAATSTDYVFTVENVRTSGDVTFSAVTLTGITGCTASVIAQPSSPLTPSSTTTFTVRVTPLLPEFTFLANVNNDRAPDPYQFNFNGMMNTGRPEMLYYRFDEGSGNQAQNDASPGRGTNPSIFNNTPTWQTTGNPVGNSSAGDNGNTTLDTGFSCTDLPRPEFTLEFWVARRGGGTNTFCGDNTAFRIYHQGPNLRIQSGPAGGDQDIDSGINMSNNTWTHLAFVSDPGVAGLTIYVNGTQQFQQVNYTFPFVNAPFHVFSNGGTDHMNGQIDEFRFWAQARSQTQISNNVNNEVIGRLEVQRPAASPIAHTATDSLGSVTTGVTQVLDYTLANTGGSGLLLGNPTVAFSGASNCNVNVTTNPSGVLVAAGGTEPAQVEVTPLSAGPFSVLLQFASNDPDVATYEVTVSGTATGSAQIQLERPATNVIPHLGNDTVTGAVAGVATNLTYTIRNPGTLPLNITGQSFSGASNCNVIVGAPSTNPIGAGLTATLPVTVTPVASGAFSFTLTVNSNAAGTPVYSVNVSGNAAVGGEIDVQRPAGVANSIADGGTDTVTGAIAGATTVLTYTIENLGTADLTLTTPNPVSGNAPVNLAFVSIVQPGINVLTPSGPNSTTTFQVGLTPAAAGAFSLQLVVDSNDIDEAVYNINISGTAAPGGEIHVERPVATNILDGGTDLLGGGHVAGVPVVLNYTVRNQGTAALTISGTNLSNFTNCVANVTGALPVSIPNGNSAVLQITVTPTIAGAFSFEIDINSDDVDEGTYDILASGTGTPGGEIQLERPGILSNGGNDPVAGTTAGVTTQITYTVRNVGTSVLTITGTGTTGALVNCGVVAGAPGSSSLSTSGPGSATTFDVDITPTQLGAWSFTLEVTSDDPSDPSFTLNVSGSAASGGEIDLQRPAATTIPNGGNDSVPGTVAGVTTQITYTVENTGTADLTVTGTGTTGPLNNVGVVVSPVGSSVLTNSGAGSITTFTVDITPTALGAWSFTVEITSNDTSDPSYTINVSDTAAAGGEIDVQRPAATTIPNGGNDSVPGTVAGVTTQVTYTVENTGTADLTITGTGTTGPLNNVSAVVSPVGSSVLTNSGAGSTTTFTVDITPTALGAWSFTVEITSNDTSDPSYTINVSDTAAPGGQIDIQRPATNTIPHAGNDNVPGTIAGATTQITYTVENLGTGDLTISGTGTSGALLNVGVVVGSAGSNVLTPSGAGSTTTFDVDITPIAAGAWSFTVEVTSDDTATPSYLVNVSGSALPGGEIGLSRGGALSDGDTDSVGTGHVAGVGLVLNYTVSNTGSAPLTITGVNFSNEVNCSATVTVSLPGIIANGNSAPLQITVTPGAAGNFNFDFDINSDDQDENPYDIHVDGDAIPGGELDLSRAGSLSDGATDGLGSGHVAGVGIVLNYSVTNSGTAALTIGGVVIGNEINCSAVVTTALPGTIANGNSAPLQITVTPVANGAFSFDFDINSDDQNEDPYDIHVDGTAAPGGEIHVERPVATAILDGDIDNAGGGHVAGVGLPLNYTVYNQGTAALAITGLVISNEVNCNAVVTTALPGSIANGANAPLQITVTPITSGTFSFDFDIQNDDVSENPYDIHVDGTAIPGGEIDVARGVALADPDTDDIGSGHVAGIGIVLNYTVANLGTSVLNISGVVISNEVNCNAVVTGALPAQINNGSPQVLQITVTPITSGNFNFDFDINSDDQNENPYDIHVDGDAIPGGEIDLARGGALADTATDNAGSGHVAGVGIVLDYTVSNLGTSVLNIAGVIITNEVNCNAVITGALPAQISNGSPQILQITVTPITSGNFNFDFDINSDDQDENPYDIHVDGDAIPGGEIDLARGGALADTATDNAGSGHVAGVGVVLDYTVSNLGTSVLNISGVAISNEVNCNVVVTGALPAQISNGSPQILQITVTPIASGNFNFDFDINSDDQDEDPYDIHVDGDAIPGGEIHVERPLTTGIADGGSDDAGAAHVAGIGSPLDYTVFNQGTAVLTVSGVVISNEVNCSVSVTTALPGTITNGTDAPLQLTVTPAAAGPFNFDFDINSDDQDENPYDIHVFGTSDPGGEIHVERPVATLLADNSVDTIGGSPIAGAPLVLNYTVFNTGSADLTISSILLVAQANCVANVTGAAPTVIANGTSEPLQITVTPTASGSFSFEIDIASDDVDESNYDILVQGSAVTGGEIDVQRPVLTSIADGGTDTVIGAVAGVFMALTYTIENLGTADLNLTTPNPVSGNTPVNLTFASITQPGLNVLTPSGPNSTTTFQIGLEPTNAGVFSLQIVIASDDLDEGSYNINISGVAVSGGEIDVQRPAATSIPAGGGDAVGSIPAGAPTVLTYTIENSGTSALDLTAQSFFSNVNCSVAIGAPSQDPIPNPGTATLAVTVTPGAGGGAWSFTLRIENDDTNEDPYDINVSGSAPSPTSVTNVTVGSDMGGPVLVSADVNGPIASSIDVTVTYSGGLNGPGACVLLDETGQPITGSVILGVTANTTITFYWDAYSNEGHHTAADYVLTLSPAIGATPGTPGSSTTFSLDRSAEWSKPYLSEEFKSPVSEHTTVYDPVNNRLVVFGGYRGASLSNDTWEFDFDTSKWHKLMTAGTPPSPRREVLSVYDPINQRMIVFGGAVSGGVSNEAFSLSLSPGGETWAPIAAASPAFPAARTHGSLVYDTLNHRAVLFGGYSSPTVFGDTWSLDLTLGTETWGSGPLAVTGTPGATVAHCSIYDPVGQRMLVLRPQGEVWELTLGATPTWAQLAATNQPPARGYMVGIYDSSRHAMVIQGGFVSNVAYIDTWTLDLGTLSWTQLQDDPGSGGRFWHTGNYLPGTDQLVVVGGRNAVRQQTDSMALYDFASSSYLTPPDAPTDASGPPTRRGAVMAYDAVNDRSLLWGGKDDETYSDLWELDRTPGAQWSKLSPSGATPNARFYAASAVDGANRTIIFGGDGAGGALNDLWALDMTAAVPSWQLLHDGSGTAPSPRWYSAMAYDSLRNQLVLFGGRDSGNFGDLWVFDLGAGTWSQPAASGTPPVARFAHGAVYDSTGDRFVVFCGRSIGEHNDVHALDLATLTWSDISAAGTSIGSRAQFAWAADATGDQVFVFGGKSTFYQLGDLWELDLSGALAAWTVLDPNDSLPPEREDPACCLDSAGILIAGTGYFAKKTVRDAWEYDTLAASPVWTEITLPDVPPNLSLSQGAYDPVANRVIVFSGEVSGSRSSGLWQLDLGTTPPSWSRIVSAGTLPRPRVGASMVYDDSGALPRMLMYGGRLSGANGTTTAEFWALELPPAGTPNWTQLANGAFNPGPRSEHAAIVDGSGNMVLFGGRNHYGWKFNDVRVFDPLTTSWSMPTTSGAVPTQREGMRAVLDYAPLAAPSRHRMIVFGGVSASGYQAQTHELDLGTWVWTDLTGGTAPAAVSHHSFVVDEAQGRALLFGGLNNNGFDQFYEFDFATDTWSAITGTHPAPQPRWGHLAVWDAVADRLVVFGGFTGTSTSESPLSEQDGTAVDTWYWGE